MMLLAKSEKQPPFFFLVLITNSSLAVFLSISECFNATSPYVSMEERATLQCKQVPSKLKCRMVSLIPREKCCKGFALGNPLGTILHVSKSLLFYWLSAVCFLYCTICGSCLTLLFCCGCGSGF